MTEAVNISGNVAAGKVPLKHVGGQMAVDHFNSNLPVHNPNIADARANIIVKKAYEKQPVTRPNVAASCSGSKKPTQLDPSEAVPYYCKGPRKKAQTKGKYKKPQTERRPIRLLPDYGLQILTNTNESSSTSNLQKTHNEGTIAQSSRHASTNDAHSEANEDADNEAETLINNLRGLSYRLNWSDTSSTALVCSDTDSFCETLCLPWHEEDQLQPQSIQHPNFMETSKLTKLVMGKACKAFGINAVGFEHELLGLILRMDQKRQDQMWKKGSAKKKGKKKGEAEVHNLICGINYDGASRGDRGRHCKILS